MWYGTHRYKKLALVSSVSRADLYCLTGERSVRGQRGLDEAFEVREAENDNDNANENKNEKRLRLDET